jgi:peptidylprolyl isomerase
VPHPFAFLLAKGWDTPNLIACNSHAPGWCLSAADPDILFKRITLESYHAMKYKFLVLLMAACATAALAQTPTSPAPAAKPPATTPPAAQAAPAPAARPAPPKPIPAADIPAQPANIKCTTYDSCVFIPPPGIPPAEGTLKTAFTLRYQDIKIGAGDTAEPGKEYIFHYTAWLASDGKQFDTSYNHRGKIMDKNEKPVKDANGNDELGPPQPLTITQGVQGDEHALTGIDQGIEGMRVGGKRRIIIPYQLAFGSRERPSPGPDFPVGIPPKSDLIFDVELLAVNDPPDKNKHMVAPPPHAPAAPRTPAKPAQSAPPAPAAPNAAAPANATQPK